MPRYVYRLSKSRFMTGVRCHRALWWTVHEPDAPELVPDPLTQRRFDWGHRVGEAARQRIPGGTLIDYPYNEFAKRIRATKNAVATGTPAIYEGAFSEGGVFTAVDILERAGAGWNLVEVKSTVEAKLEHVPDVAVQTHVLRLAGINVQAVHLMHLNRECRYPDLSNLFARADLTGQAMGFLPTIPEEVERQISMLAGLVPDAVIGPNCREPYVCPFVDRCSPDLPEHHISTLYRLGTKAADVEAQGFPTIYDLPPDYPLSEAADRQRRAVQSGKMIVEPGLREALAPIVAPVAFLDFETVQLPIPAWDGCGPYHQVPVQFSCHVQAEDGNLTHHEWIAEGPNDPRRELATRVVAACATARTIVVYNASFERQRLVELQGALPDLADPLQVVIDRLLDLLPVMRNYVYHPAFGGSFSLKAVLPALVPDLSYANLEVQEGGTATATLEALTIAGAEFTPSQRAHMRKELLRYCELDTLAMVRLLRVLQGLAR